MIDRFQQVRLHFYLLFAAVAAAAAPHPRHASHSVNQDVKPSPEIEAKINDEVAKAKQILEHLDTKNFAASPYLVSAVYYHDGFLTDFEVDRNTADPNRRIVGRISQVLTPQLKVQFVKVMHQYWIHSEPQGIAYFSNPVPYSVMSTDSRDHQFAIDLFSYEGAPVLAATRGIVILAEQGWTASNSLSTSSRKGGNSIIIFAPDQNRFYRYCHLSAIHVSTGQIILAGQQIGSVGHTGLNASQPGHGQHLHFEVNEYSDGHVRAIDFHRLRVMLHPTS